MRMPHLPALSNGLTACLRLPCRNEDFYSRASTADLPGHDVLVTNPPYSGTHVPRLLTFCQKHTQAWLLLLPSYVVAKPAYAEAAAAMQHAPFVCAPRKRYVYWTPKGAGRGNPKVRKDGRTSPFVSLWCAVCNITDRHVAR